MEINSCKDSDPDPDPDPAERTMLGWAEKQFYNRVV